MRPISNTAARYGVAVLLVAAATVFHLLVLNPYWGLHLPFAPFGLATVIAAYLAGSSPAIVTLVLSTLVGIFIAPPRFGWVIAAGAPGLAMEVLGAIAAIWAIALIRRGQADLQASENALRQRTAELDALFKHAPIGFAFFDREHRYVRINEELARIHGIVERAHIGRRLSELLPHGASAVDPYIEQVFATGRPARTETSCNPASEPDTTRHSLLGLFPVFGENREIALVGEFVLEITGRKLAEDALRESEQREHRRAEELEAIMNAVPAVTMITRDPECRFMTGSRAAYELLRMHPGSNLAKVEENKVPYRMLQEGTEVPQDEMPIRKAALTGQPVWNSEFDLAFDDGTVRMMIGHAVPLLDADGHPRGGVGAFLDITEYRRAEERLRAAEKMESVGVLAAGIAHQFNNALGGILGYAGLLRNDVPERSLAKLDAIEQASQHAAALTQQLVAYAGKGRTVMGPVDLSKMIRNMDWRLNAAIPDHVVLRRDLQSDLPAVHADPAQMEQIAMNLVMNAVEAIPDDRRGTVEVRTCFVRVGPDRPVLCAFTHEPARSGDYACLEVRDDGVGIDAETRARMFDPFFTTKFMGRGLGLPAVAGVVKAHGGAIEIDSEPGRGSAFRVFLPVAEETATHRPGAPASEGTVLVLDEEEMMRVFVRAVLQKHGYQVMEAQSAQDAKRIAAENGTLIRLAIVDATPEAKGADSLISLRQSFPELPIVATGVSSEEQEAEFLPASAFLPKPFTADDLASKVEAILAETRSDTTR